MFERLFIFGSSHVSQFCGEDRIIPESNELIRFESDKLEYHVMRLGPCTAYNFFWNESYYPRVLRVLRGMSQEGAAVCLMLGEIDCRVHIGRRLEGGASLVEAVEEVVDRLSMCLIDLGKRGWNVVVIGVQPASTHPPCTIEWCPAVGTCEQRNLITREMNRQLERKCRIHGFKWCSVFDQLMLDDGSPNMSYFMDYVHLRGSMVRSLYEEQLVSE